MKSNLSVCIIAKNEENFIESCLNSIISLADEIIILDTGSTDKTIKIINNYSDRLTGNKKGKVSLYHTKWQDDFSKARNECISYASGDWILSIDANEILSEFTGKNLKEFLDKQDYQKEIVFCFKIVNKGAINTSSFYRVSVFSNRLDFYYKNKIHEQINSDKYQIKPMHCHYFQIFHQNHRLSTQETQLKSRNYIKILENLLKEAKGMDIIYNSFYLANAYSGDNEHDKAVIMLEKAYSGLINYEKLNKLSEYDKTSFKGNILIRLIRELIIFQNNFDKALEYIQKILEMSPDFTDALFYQAYCLEYKKDYDKSLDIYQKILKLFNIEQNTNPYGIISQEKTIIPRVLFESSRLYYLNNNKRLALKSLEAANQLLQNFSSIMLHLEKYYVLEENLAKATEIHQKINYGKLKPEQEEIFKLSKTFNYKNPAFYKMLSELCRYLLLHDEWLDDEKSQLKVKENEFQAKYLHLLGDIFSNNKDYDKALASYLKSRSLSGNKITERLELSIVFLYLFIYHDYPKALELLEKTDFITLIKKLFYMAFAYQNLSKFTLALNLYNQLLEEKELNKDMRSTIMIEKSRIYREKGEYNKELNELEESLSVNHSARAKLFIHKHYLLSFDLTNAVKYLINENQRLKAIKENSPYYRYTIYKLLKSLIGSQEFSKSEKAEIKNKVMNKDKNEHN